MKAFTVHINAMAHKIIFSHKDVRDNIFAFLDWSVYNEADRSPKKEVYGKNMHIGQYLLLYSLNPLQLKLGVIQTLNHWAQMAPLRDNGKEGNHVRKSLKRCGYPGWHFLNPQRSTTTKQMKAKQQHSNTIHCMRKNSEEFPRDTISLYILHLATHSETGPIYGKKIPRYK